MSRPAVAKRFGDGSVYWYKNEGSTEKAKLAAGQQLVGASQFGFDFSKYKPGMWGVRVKVCVTDWTATVSWICCSETEAVKWSNRRGTTNQKSSPWIRACLLAEGDG